MKVEKEYKKEAYDRAARVQAKIQTESQEKAILNETYASIIDDRATDIEIDIINHLMSKKKAHGAYFHAYLDALRLSALLDGQVRSSFIMTRIAFNQGLKKETIAYFLRVLKSEGLITSSSTTARKGRIFYITLNMDKIDLLEAEIKAKKKRIDDNSDVDTVQ